MLRRFPSPHHSPLAPTLTPGIHLNFFPMLPPEGADLASLDEFDQKGLARAAAWGQWGQGYRIEQSTKPATIGAVLESSPVAVLAW